MGETFSEHELEHRLASLNKAYRDGNPVVSDGEYDELLDSYRKMVGDGRYCVFRKTLFEDSGSVRHPHIMGSLEKVKNEDPDDALADWILNNVFPNDVGSLFVSAKVDGCSLRLQYDNGRLVDAVTRGDGLSGVSIYEKAKMFVPTTLDDGYTGNIRGECTLTHDSFDELKTVTNQEYKNLRNATVGVVNSKDSDLSNCRFLRIIAYHMMDEKSMTKEAQFDWLEKHGFQTPLHENVDFEMGRMSIEEFRQYLDAKMMEIFSRYQSRADYDMDGLVVNDRGETDFETGGKIPVNMIAFKPNQLTAHTSLLGIDWQISKSGYFTPVGLIDPVELGGATIGRVTLNNLGFVRDNGLHVGIGLDILKSGDIIPKVVNVCHDDEDGVASGDLVPSICPHCGHDLVVEGCELRCPNEECPERHVMQTAMFLKSLGVKNYDRAVLRELGVRRIEDVARYVDDGSVRGKKLSSAIAKYVYGANVLDLLSAFDWNGLGKKTLKRMADTYGFGCLIDPDFGAMQSNLPEGVGLGLLHLYEQGYAENVRLFRLFVDDVRFTGEKTIGKLKPVVGKLSGMSFCVTGELSSMSREEFGRVVIENGGLLKNSVTKKVTHLVTNNPQSNSSKNRKARELGVKAISEEQFLGMIGESKQELYDL